MRLLAIFAATAIAGCSSLGGQEQSLAQCELEANEPRGAKFQQDYVGSPPLESTKDQAYSAFLITCMKAKGYKFAEPFDDAGGLNERCWFKEASGNIESMPWAGGQGCFSRSVW